MPCQTMVHAAEVDAQDLEFLFANVVFGVQSAKMCEHEEAMSEDGPW